MLRKCDSMAEKFYGKYRALITDINDPENRGRIRVRCPKILGNSKSPWCEPCIPFAYDGGGDFAVPKVGEFVWVEFEEGDPNYPIYTGGLWSKNSVPKLDPDSRIIEWNGAKILFKNGTVYVNGVDILLSIAKLSPGVYIDEKGQAVFNPLPDADFDLSFINDGDLYAEIYQDLLDLSLTNEGEVILLFEEPEETPEGGTS